MRKLVVKIKGISDKWMDVLSEIVDILFPFLLTVALVIALFAVAMIFLVFIALVRSV